MGSLLFILLLFCVELCFCVFLTSSCVQCAQCCQCLWIVFILCLVCSMLSVSLDCLHPVTSVLNVVSISGFSSSCVQCAQCCQCLWIVFVLCLVCPMLSVSLDCLRPVSSVPNVASVSGLSSSCVQCAQCCQCLDGPFVIPSSVSSNVYLHHQIHSLSTTPNTQFIYHTKYTVYLPHQIHLNIILERFSIFSYINNHLQCKSIGSVYVQQCVHLAVIVRNIYMYINFHFTPTLCICIYIQIKNDDVVIVEYQSNFILLQACRYTRGNEKPQI